MTAPQFSNDAHTLLPKRMFPPSGVMLIEAGGQHAKKGRRDDSQPASRCELIGCQDQGIANDGRYWSDDGHGRHSVPLNNIQTGLKWTGDLVGVGTCSSSGLAAMTSWPWATDLPTYGCIRTVVSVARDELFLSTRT